MNNKQLNIIAKIALLFSLSTLSLANFESMQATIRTGMIKGSYANPLTTGSGTEETSSGANASSNLEGGGFSVMPSLDADIEMFKKTLQK